MTAQAYGHKTTSFSNLPNLAEKRDLFMALGILLIFAGALAIYLAVYSTLLTISVEWFLLAGFFYWLMPL
jgi:hypothetical protein